MLVEIYKPTNLNARLHCDPKQHRNLSICQLCTLGAGCKLQQHKWVSNATHTIKTDMKTPVPMAWQNSILLRNHIIHTTSILLRNHNTHDFYKWPKCLLHNPMVPSYKLWCFKIESIMFPKWSTLLDTDNYWNVSIPGIPLTCSRLLSNTTHLFTCTWEGGREGNAKMEKEVWTKYKELYSDDGKTNTWNYSTMTIYIV